MQPNLHLFCCEMTLFGTAQNCSTVHVSLFLTYFILKWFILSNKLHKSESEQRRRGCWVQLPFLLFFARCLRVTDVSLPGPVKFVAASMWLRWAFVTTTESEKFWGLRFWKLKTKGRRHRDETFYSTLEKKKERMEPHSRVPSNF